MAKRFNNLEELSIFLDKQIEKLGGLREKIRTDRTCSTCYWFDGDCRHTVFNFLINKMNKEESEIFGCKFHEEKKEAIK